jgi:error-prone DNA polymerase
MSRSPAFAELCAISNFSFLEGASHPDELVAQAQALGLSALAVCDRNTLAGVVRAHVAAKDVGLQLIIGARLDLEDGPSLVCLPTDRAAYGRLCRLLSLGQRRAVKGACSLRLCDVAHNRLGQQFIVLPPAEWDWRCEERQVEHRLAFDVRRVAGALKGASVFLAAWSDYSGDDAARLAALAQISLETGVAMVASNAVRMHAPQRRRLADVLACVRAGMVVSQAGYTIAANAERHIKSPAAMARLFKAYPEAIARTVEIARACTFSLDELVYEYPEEPVPPGATPDAHLADLTWEGARERYPDVIPQGVSDTLKKELGLIAQMTYAPYFLTVHDLVRFARARGILCQGRGSAANSAVCYCLGITSVNPAETDLLFERFITPERREPPDIDVDFEHERREEVIQYIYQRYGRDRAGLAATVISYRARSAVRDVGKAMGLSEDTLTALAGMVWGTRSGGALPERYVREAGLDPGDPLLATVLELAEDLIGFPRHLSQHVGGFVLTRGPLNEVVPIGNGAMADRTFIEWDKNDLAAVGLLKVDVLALGMLTCIHRAFDLIDAHYGRHLTLANIPREDPAVYDMLCVADSLGVFQVESRAQMNMLPRLKPRTFYDLVIEVAIVRPGPIQGDMVHPYLRRRDGLEPEYYPAPAPEHGPVDELRQILGKTKGVPLFQEQAMRIAMVAARFSDAEVNELRKAMATFRRRGTIGLLEEKMVSQMVARGYNPEFAARCFSQIKGFGEYGFPESHAASFALLVYVSSWIKCHYPDVFACALLNSQPMGFYAPAQIVRDAREHGVEVRPVDVSVSAWDCMLEPRDDAVASRGFPVRLGLRQVDGMSQVEAARIVAGRAMPQGEPAEVFTALPDFMDKTHIHRGTLDRLAAADSFRSLGLDRRQALWEAQALTPVETLPLFAWGATQEAGPEPPVALEAMPMSEHVVADYQTLRLSLKAHPMSFLRSKLDH